MKYTVYALLVLVLASCAAHLPIQESYPSFSARLMIITPKHRWQVIMDWHATQVDEGWLRLSHAATSRVIKMRWKRPQIWLLDNQAASGRWQKIEQEKLTAQGIPLPPWVLASFLLHHSAQGFIPHGEKRWIMKNDTQHMIVAWDGARLSISDIAHGRRATLIMMQQTDD